MNILSNYDVTYELNNYTKNFKVYNNFRVYSRIRNQIKAVNLEVLLNKFNKIKKKILKIFCRSFYSDRKNI